MPFDMPLEDFGIIPETHFPIVNHMMVDDIIFGFIFMDIDSLNIFFQ